MEGDKRRKRSRNVFSSFDGLHRKGHCERNRELAQMLTLTGTDGFIEIGLWEPHVRIRAAKGKAFQNFRRLDVAVSRRPPQDSSFVDQLRHFVWPFRRTNLACDGRRRHGAVDVVSRAYSTEPSFASPGRSSF